MWIKCYHSVSNEFDSTPIWILQRWKRIWTHSHLGTWEEKNSHFFLRALTWSFDNSENSKPGRWWGHLAQVTNCACEVCPEVSEEDFSPWRKQCLAQGWHRGVDLTTWKRRKNGLSEMCRFEEVGLCGMAGLFFLYHGTWAALGNRFLMLQKDKTVWCWLALGTQLQFKCIDSTRMALFSSRIQLPTRQTPWWSLFKKQEASLKL